MPPTQHFVRAEMLPSGYLIRPCEGGGSIIHVVDHMDLEVCKSCHCIIYECIRSLAVRIKPFLSCSLGVYLKCCARFTSHQRCLLRRQQWR
jgi:hypothetical protein